VSCLVRVPGVWVQDVVGRECLFPCGAMNREILEACRPLAVKVFKLDAGVLAWWMSTKTASYAGHHGYGNIQWGATC